MKLIDQVLALELHHRAGMERAYTLPIPAAWRNRELEYQRSQYHYHLGARDKCLLISQYLKAWNDERAARLMIARWYYGGGPETASGTYYARARRRGGRALLESFMRDARRG